MKVSLISSGEKEFAESILKPFYDQGVIPPEKKPYLTQLSKGFGPYLGIEGSNGSTRYILDAASQIATLGLGFNAPALFAPIHFDASIDGENDEIAHLRCAYHGLITRHCGPKHITYANSGAEACELALGLAFYHRQIKKASKVLAFEGSFHGRMQIALSSTWNPSKRKEFQWPSFETQFCSYPDNPTGQIDPTANDEWVKAFSHSGLKNFKSPQSNSDLEERELKSLSQVREQLLTGNIFAVIIEPMQCEGGDRYSTRRFHHCLALLCQAFQVALVYDEVQTGFHLGRTFFWHRDLLPSHISPDYVFVAKKAQCAMTLSTRPIPPEFQNREFSHMGLIRAFAQALALEQFHQRILRLEGLANQYLQDWAKKFPNDLENPRCRGLAFSIDLKNIAKLNEFINLRFDWGLLYYPAGDNTLRFRLNTSFQKEDLDYLFMALEKISAVIFRGEKHSPPGFLERADSNLGHLILWQERLVAKQLPNEALQFSTQFFKKECNLNLIEFSSQNFPQYAQAIDDIQKSVYEEVRQTELRKFSELLNNPHAIALGLTDDNNQLVAISFAGPLADFSDERGVLRDCDFHNPKSLYMLDTTLIHAYKGKGLGAYLKYALTLIAKERGIHSISGRNRSILAARMMAINLSLGAVPLEHVSNDYLDNHENRDVYYYKIKTIRPSHPLTLSNGLICPNPEMNASESWPVMVNKVCLSNFISRTFLEDLNKLASLAPQTHRHVLTASGHAECVDKIAKTLWLKNKGPSAPQLWTFRGSYFGIGSFIARGLNDQFESLFPVQHFDYPNESNSEEILEKIQESLSIARPLGIFIEPITQRFFLRAPRSFLKGLNALCRSENIPLVYDETLSSLYAYSDTHFYASCDPELTPSAFFHYLGGQSGVCYFNSSLFVATPLALISTWDGDEYSLSAYSKLVANYTKERIKKIRSEFTQSILIWAEQFQLDQVRIDRGIGFIQGPIPPSFQKFFIKSQGRFLVTPSLRAMQDFTHNREIYE